MQPLTPADLAEVLRYVRMRSAAQIADLNPPTAAQWERLTEWDPRKADYETKRVNVRVVIEEVTDTE